MKYPEQVLCRTLSASPEVAKHLGFRLFPLIAPVSADLPLGVYRRSSAQREESLTLPPGVVKTGLELELFALSYATVRELADACRKTLDHLGTSSQGVTVHRVTIDGETERMVQLEGGDLPPAWQVTMSLTIQWSE